MKDFFEFKINIVDISALFVSIIAIFWTWITDKKLKQQQQKINEYLISSYSKADLIVSVVDVEGKKRITVTNKGGSAAKNIFIKWNGLDKNEGIVIKEQGKLPYSILNSGESFYITIALWGLSNRNPIISLLWEDDYSKNNRKETSISF